jgi:hypothetical protein
MISGKRCGNHDLLFGCDVTYSSCTGSHSRNKIMLVYTQRPYFTAGHDLLISLDDFPILDVNLLPAKLDSGSAGIDEFFLVGFYHSLVVRVCPPHVLANDKQKRELCPWFEQLTFYRLLKTFLAVHQQFHNAIPTNIA